MRTRIIANVRALNRFGSATHAIANAVNRLPPVRALGNRLMGFHPKRALPRFGQSLYRWMAARGESDGKGRATVMLFPDCFTVYNEPHIGRAAVLALERLGYRVVLPRSPVGCCGRTYLSTGMLQQAQRVCRTTAAALLECVQREHAVAVVACEPSCLSAIKDDWLELDMGLEADPLRELARKSFLVEQFIDEQWDSHPQQPLIQRSAATSESSIILHGHCHQKALWGAETSARALRRLHGGVVRVLDSGCCGMAGQFGYARRHYDLSMKIGELSLFGALREHPEAIIAAPGTSCRQQIHDGTDGRAALHPIEIVAQALGV